MSKIVHKLKWHTQTDMIGQPVDETRTNLCDGMSLDKTTQNDSEVTCKRCLKKLSQEKETGRK